MSKMSEYSVKKPVTIIMAVLIVVILGFVSLINTTTDLFPSMNLPYAIISTQYIGASPDEVEMIVTKPIESSMATVSNIKEIQSVSREHSSMVILEFNEETNMDSALIEMREKLDMILTYLPDEVSSPMILKISPDMMPIMQFSISYSGKDISDMTLWLENITPRIERIPGVASLSLTGTADNQIHISLNEDLIAEVNQNMNDIAREQTILGLVAEGTPREMAEKMVPQDLDLPGMSITSEMISGILAGQNFSMPAGYVNDDEIDYLVRTGDKLEDLDAVKDLPIMVTPMMTVTLSDVADVEMVNINNESYSKVNGEDAIILAVQKQNNFATTDVADEVMKELEKIREDYPDAEVNILMDQAEYINVSISSVTNNLLYGAILAIFILILFLRNLKPTLIIALAIPISVMTAFIMIYFTGITLNIVSMGGLALGIGMLVDNSIVVIENIYRLRSEGKSAKDASIIGAKQVAGAITASTLTTIAVFVPIVFMKGFTAQIFLEMALTISFSLIASLLIALSLVPMLASQMMIKMKNTEEGKTTTRFKSLYTSALKFSLRNKLVIMVLVFLLFGGSIYGSFQIGAEFFPTGDEGQIMVNLNMPKGTEFEQITKALDDITYELKQIDDVETVSATVSGGIEAMFMGGGNGTINVLLSDDREKTTEEVTKEIREVTDELQYDITIQATGSGPQQMTGSGNSVVIKGHDIKELERIADEVASIIAAVEGTTEVDSGISKTAPELKITVNREESIKHGLTTAQVFMAINDTLKEQDKASTININGQDYDINVYAPDTEKVVVDIDYIRNLEIESPMGGTVMVSEIAEVMIDTGYAEINRDNQSRTLTVTSQVEEGYNVGLVGQEINNALQDYDAPDGYSVETTGEFQEIVDAMVDLGLALLLAVVLIYMIMASQFQSLKYPFIVMFTIPLAFTGGFIALLATNTPVSVVAFIGLIILAGVVVNNGIVLIDYINQLRDSGMSTYDAIIEAGNTRLRPIVMTALTTILALATMALGIGEGSEMMQPMAITAIGGLIYATILTLIVVPVMYASFNRVKIKKEA